MRVGHKMNAGQEAMAVHRDSNCNLLGQSGGIQKHYQHAKSRMALATQDGFIIWGGPLGGDTHPSTPVAEGADTSITNDLWHGMQPTMGQELGA